MTEEITPAMRAAGAAAAFEGPWPDNVDAIYRAMRNAAPRRAIMLETAAADDEAQDREKDWRAVCAGTATLDQFVAAVSYAAACAGWDGSPSGAALDRPHSAVAPAGDGVEDRDALAERLCAARFPTTVARHPDYYRVQLTEESRERWRVVADAALARPRAAVGERTVAMPIEPSAAMLRAGWLVEPGEDRLARERYAAILALQSPPAKVEG